MGFKVGHLLCKLYRESAKNWAKEAIPGPWLIQQDIVNIIFSCIIFRHQDYCPRVSTSLQQEKD